MKSQQFKRYSDKGLTGLCNMGNTCYANTCMQMLSHTYELNDILDTSAINASSTVDTDDAELLSEWNTLRKLMWKKNCVISPGGFIHTIQQVATNKGMELFTGYAQNDMSEFLLFLIDCFHTTIARPVTMGLTGNPKAPVDNLAIKVYSMVKDTYKKEYSEIWNLFYGTHVSEIIDAADPSVVLSQRPEPFFTVSLQIPTSFTKSSTSSKSTEYGQITLCDCFDDYVAGELLCGENAWHNDRTNRKQDVVKRISYWAFPPILCIDLKRFDSRNVKKRTLVTYPLEGLDLSPYVIGYNPESYMYDLYGVCNHIGSSRGGHYTGYIKNANGFWYEFNDASVTHISDAKRIVTANAYCLFYRKRTLTAS